MSRAVQFAKFGDVDVFSVEDVAEPTAGPGEIRVRVVATGINPVDWKIASSADAHRMYNAPQLPTGNGNDFAGTVDQVGEGVDGIAVGDAVFGGARFFAQADFVVTTPDRVRLKPLALSFEQAGSLDIAGRTALAEVVSQNLTDSDTVLISAAAGGVGVIACQLALRSGATVIGTASDHNHAFLTELGVIPVAYGEGLVGRIRSAAPQGITVVLDNNGASTIEAALELGVPVDRINTIAARSFVESHGIKGVGGAAASLDDLAHLADLIAAGEIVLPIDSEYPLEQVVDAYRHLKAGHLRGKIVLVTGAHQAGAE